MHAVLEELGKIGIVPVIKIDDAEKAVPLAKALRDGGIPCAEITFRTAQGEEAIRRIHKEVPEVLLGAGTVLTVDQVKKAADAGARFIVSPGFNPKVVGYCIEQGIPITPGCSNPSDIEAALEFGLEVIKFFPAEQSGGLEYIKAVAAPFGAVKFMPTGGINAGNIAKYCSYDRILACGGSWMVGADLINSGNFSAVTALCREALRTALGFHIAHVGINAENEAEALRAAGLFEALFGFAAKPGNSSVFAGEGIEIMKTPYLGKNGHIAVGTNNITMAMGCLERMGCRFNTESLKKDAGGRLIAVYLADEIAGFAVHLMQKK
ncbi:bifunctional 4-hydroxy-2-oxoglutarate aldolase/2-dehydro-3-deoxy-phosphogluconate aldolase [Breznakiella homolactica]|uniref:2-dehydro-3-deoxy-phosphogluconate aldolase n=1 Tax=Breznakiella homolactica TaxID=2798577 RepID=A0A7T8B8M1_9SPIR|nr:bifunctional 4-hydroxy-2-oxoglutarate aldolase/2-dehydro-3-deoxy-phosphogluconate aldolase [Breznakiella homolactica]QQO07461.1 bifunctional 4-hydroxy-2-oxoglutarate aldolase/2-dehydro-3-deoxy-phosphogluconate aldolase [Breznakiella homolactica]